MVIGPFRSANVRPGPAGPEETEAIVVLAFDRGEDGELLRRIARPTSRVKSAPPAPPKRFQDNMSASSPGTGALNPCSAIPERQLCLR